MTKLKIVYYFNKNNPVKTFLKKYFPTEDDSEKQKTDKTEILIKIDKIINHVAQNGCMPKRPTSGWLTGYDFYEIICNYKDIYIRILYDCYNNEKLVLLNAYEKPRLYQRGTSEYRKVIKHIERENDKAKSFYDNFIINPQNYEKYE